MPAIKISEREKFLMVVTAASVILYVFYNFLLTPKWNEIGKLKERATGARIELRIAESKIKLLEKMKKIYAEPEKAPGTKLERALLALRQMSSTITSAGVELMMLKPKLDPAADRIDFDLSCRSTYDELYGFLSRLAKLKTIVMVKTLTIKGGAQKNRNLNVQMSVTALL